MWTRLLGKSDHKDNDRSSHTSRRKRHSNSATASSRGDDRDRGKSKEKRKDREKHPKSPDQEDERSSIRNRRVNEDNGRTQDRSLDEPSNGYGEETSRTVGDDFSAQVGRTDFMQFPGQYDALPFVGGPVGQASTQLPVQVTDRNPIANQLRPGGLAAEYYANSSDLGTAPEIQPASAHAAAPLEPNVSGLSGQAASYYAADSTYPSTAASAIPTFGIPSTGIAAIDNQYSTNLASLGEGNRPEFTQHSRPPQAQYLNNTTAASGRPFALGEQLSQPYGVSFNAGKISGAAGFVAAESSNFSQLPQTASSAVQYQMSPTIQQYRHGGPLSILVDFFKDPEGVSKFEEYSEYIGVCKNCFAPGSSPKDAPRKHSYRRRRSGDRRSSNLRIDKDSRYWSSDSESRRRTKKSWLKTWIAGYGIAKVAESLFNGNHNSDDTLSDQSRDAKNTHEPLVNQRKNSASKREGHYSQMATRLSPESRTRRESQSKHRSEAQVYSDSKVSREGWGVENSGALSGTTHERRHLSSSRPRSRSRTDDHISRATEGAIGGALGSSIARPSLRRRSRSSQHSSMNSTDEAENQNHNPTYNAKSNERPTSHNIRHPRKFSPSSYASRPPVSGGNDPGKQPRSRKKETKASGFFGFGNESSASEEGEKNLDFETKDQRRGNKSKTKERNREADAALMGLGVAAAALVLNEKRRKSKAKGKSELVAVKESRHSQIRKLDHDHKFNKALLAVSSGDDLWVSASDDEYVSADTDLAYGKSARWEKSQESLSSNSSGTNSWSWRWGSKKGSRRVEKQGKPSTQNQAAAHTGMAVGSSTKAGFNGSFGSDQQQKPEEKTTNSSLPLQHVHPISTSDPSQFDVSVNRAVEYSGQPKILSRPAPIPLQHPQPVAPVPAAVYGTQPTNVHSYSAPNGAQEISWRHDQWPPNASSGRTQGYQYVTEKDIPNNFKQSEHRPNVVEHEIRAPQPKKGSDYPRVHNSSSASRSASSNPFVSFRNDQSTSRTAVAEDQAEEDRHEKRRQQPEEEAREWRRQHQGGEIQAQLPRDRKVQEAISTEPPNVKYMDNIKVEQNQVKFAPRVIEIEPRKRSSWTAPAAGDIGNIPESALSELKILESDLKSEDHRTQKRKERSYDDDPPNNDQCPIPAKEVISRTNDPDPEIPMSFWQAAAQISRRTSSHEDYGTFFAPPELQYNLSSQKENTGTDVDDNKSNRPPRIITIVPTGIHESLHSPAYSFSASADELDVNPMGLPWVPKLNLIAPTPISSQAGLLSPSLSPSRHPERGKEAEICESPESEKNSGVPWSEPRIVGHGSATPAYYHGQIVDSPSVNHPNCEDSQTKPTDETVGEKEPSLPIDSTWSNHVGPDYGDDLEFAATVAAGLEETGFDPFIVINDPEFSRRKSPPGLEQQRNFQASTSNAMDESEVGSPVTEAVLPQQPTFIEDNIASITMPGAFKDEQPDTEVDKQNNGGSNIVSEQQVPADISSERPDNEAVGELEKSNLHKNTTASCVGGLDAVHLESAEDAVGERPEFKISTQGKKKKGKSSKRQIFSNVSPERNTKVTFDDEVKEPVLKADVEGSGLSNLTHNLHIIQQESVGNERAEPITLAKEQPSNKNNRQEQREKDENQRRQGSADERHNDKTYVPEDSTLKSNVENFELSKTNSNPDDIAQPELDQNEIAIPGSFIDEDQPDTKVSKREEENEDRYLQRQNSSNDSSERHSNEVVKELENSTTKSNFENVISSNPIDNGITQADYDESEIVVAGNPTEDQLYTKISKRETKEKDKRQKPQNISLERRSDESLDKLISTRPKIEKPTSSDSIENFDDNAQANYGESEAVKPENHTEGLPNTGINNSEKKIEGKISKHKKPSDNVLDRYSDEIAQVDYEESEAILPKNYTEDQPDVQVNKQERKKKDKSSKRQKFRDNSPERRSDEVAQVGYEESEAIAPENPIKDPTENPTADPTENQPDIQVSKREKKKKDKTSKRQKPREYSPERRSDEVAQADYGESEAIKPESPTKDPMEDQPDIQVNKRERKKKDKTSKRQKPREYSPERRSDEVAQVGYEESEVVIPENPMENPTKDKPDTQIDKWEKKKKDKISKREKLRGVSPERCGDEFAQTGYKESEVIVPENLTGNHTKGQPDTRINERERKKKDEISKTEESRDVSPERRSDETVDELKDPVIKSNSEKMTSLSFMNNSDDIVPAKLDKEEVAVPDNLPVEQHDIKISKREKKKKDRASKRQRSTSPDRYNNERANELEALVSTSNAENVESFSSTDKPNMAEPRSDENEIANNTVPSFSHEERPEFKTSKREKKKKEKISKRQISAGISPEGFRSDIVDDSDRVALKSNLENAQNSSSIGIADPVHHNDLESVVAASEAIIQPLPSHEQSREHRSSDAIGTENGNQILDSQSVKDAPVESANMPSTDIFGDGHNESPAAVCSSLEDSNKGKFSSNRRLSGSPDQFETPLEEPLSVTQGFPGSHGYLESKKTGKNSKGKDKYSADPTSASASVANADELKTRGKKAKKGFAGLLKRSTDDVPELAEAEEKTVEATFDDFDEPKKRGKKSKNRKSAQASEEGKDTKADAARPLESLDKNKRLDKSVKPMEVKTEQHDTRVSTPEDSGRTTQGLPAETHSQAPVDPSLTDMLLTDTKDQTSTSSNEASKIGNKCTLLGDVNKEHNFEDSKSLSFLGERQEIPPLPDGADEFKSSKVEEDEAARDSVDLSQLSHRELIFDGIEDKNNPFLNSSGRPPRSISIPDTKGQMVPERQVMDDIKPFARISSPTAVPLNFRLPPPSPGLRRSLSSAPLSPVSSSTSIISPSQKHRPRSTEFKSSTEFRPLWLLETYRARQEPSQDEPYPPLPSSHSTSRNSSAHCMEGSNFDQLAGHNLIDPYDESYTVEPTLTADTNQVALLRNLLDSEQLPPTAPPHQLEVTADTRNQIVIEQELDLNSATTMKSLQHHSTQSSPRRRSNHLETLSEKSQSAPFFPSVSESIQRMPSLQSSQAPSPDRFPERVERQDLFNLEVVPTISRQAISYFDHVSEPLQDLPPLPSSRVSSVDPYLECSEQKDNYILEDSPPSPSYLQASRLDCVVEPLQELPPLPSSPTSSAGSLLERVEQEGLFMSKVCTSPSRQTILNPGPIYETLQELPLLPSSRTSSEDLYTKGEKQKDLFVSEPVEPSFRQTISHCNYVYDPLQDLPSLPSSGRASSSSFDHERVQQQDLSISRDITYDSPAILPSLPSSHTSSADPYYDRVEQFVSEAAASPFHQSSPYFDHVSDSLQELPSLPSSRASFGNLNLEFIEQQEFSTSQATALVDRQLALSSLPSSHVSSPDPYREHAEQRDLLTSEVAALPNGNVILHNESDLKSVQDFPSTSNNEPLSSDVLHESFVQQVTSELQVVTSPDRSLSSPIMHPLPSSRAPSSRPDIESLELDRLSKSEIVASPNLPLNSSSLPDNGVSSSRPDLLHLEQETLSKSEAAALPSPCPTLPSLPSSRASSSKPNLERLKQESLPESEATASANIHPALPSLPNSQASSLELGLEHEGPSKPEAGASPKLDSILLSLSSRQASSPNPDLEHLEYLEQESLSKSKSNLNPTLSSLPNGRTSSLDCYDERFEPEGQPLPEAQEPPFRPSTLSSLPSNQATFSEPYHEQFEQGDMSKSDAAAPSNSRLNLPADSISSPISKVSPSWPDGQALFPDHSQMLLEQPKIPSKLEIAASPDPQSSLRFDNDFESAQDLPSLPSSQVLSSNPVHEPYEPFEQQKIASTSEIVISRDSHSNLDFDPDFEPPQDLPSLPSSRASSLDSSHDRFKEQEILCTSEAAVSRSSHLSLDMHSVLDPAQTFQPAPGCPASASDTNHERLKQETSFEPDIVKAVYEPHAYKAIEAGERDLSPAIFNTIPDIDQGTHTSRFGTLVDISDDLRPPKSPFPNSTPGRQRLDTITEYGQEESPLDARSPIVPKNGTLDGGSGSGRRPSTPQRISRQRVRSLPDADSTTKSLISTDYLIARLSWPPIDEETDSVDLERSRSRHADSSSSSRPPDNLTSAVGSGRQRDGEPRSASGSSVRSIESINVVLQTPDQIRCASGMSQRSSGTPPLRRSDRSVSGDLRLASKRSEAKNLAKTTSEPETSIPVFASSSTYDPARDKGKSRASDMADVYVSHHNPSIYSVNIMQT